MLMNDKPEATMAAPIMKEAKRGRLKRVTIKSMYGKDGNLAGHTVTAEHEPEMSGDGKGQPSMMGGYPPHIETPHETYDSAEAKVREHHLENAKKFGSGKKATTLGDDMPMRVALARRR
jgi:hypothetical protein